MRNKSIRNKLLVITAAFAAATLPGGAAVATATPSPQPAASHNSLPGQLAGLLPSDKIVLRSADKVDLDKDTVTLPLRKGNANGKTVWYIITEASDVGIAHDLNVNYAPKLINMPIGCTACVQDVTLKTPSVEENRFGPAEINFNGGVDFSPARVLNPGPGVFPPATAEPGAVGETGYSPFIRVNGSPVVYNAPIVAVGDGPFDVIHHTNTADRVLGVHPAAPSGPGQYHQASVDLLLVHGFDAGQPILYISTESNDKVTATLERATYVPTLSQSPFNGGDDDLGSARERIFPFINGQVGANNSQAQGLIHLIKDGHATEDAYAGNVGLIQALRNGGDALNVQGDFPTLTDPRHSEAYSPLWEAQFGQWTDKAIKLGLDKRQIDENQIFNLAATHPDLITGPNGGPFGGQGVVINCPVIGFTLNAPADSLAAPVDGSQH
ncbi:MAG: hypothetical protein JWQ81_5877 [Amycolatopsis sp.]|jgi:hypothetical protein|nr:hypothetical protein [Amycolatopsis sp.]